MNLFRGETVCTNRTRMRRDVLERELLAGLQAQVLREDVVDYVLERFERELTRELENISGEMDQMRKRKGELEVEIQRLADRLASGIHSSSVMSEIARRERKVSEIWDRLLSSQRESIRSRIASLKERAMSRIRDLRQCLNGDPQTVRAYFNRHIEKIVMEPGGRAYVASGAWNLRADIRWDGAGGQS